MKKLIAVILAVMLLCTLTACKKAETEELTTNADSFVYTDNEENSEPVITDENTVAKQLSAEFIRLTETETDITAQVIADKLLASPVISFSGISSAVSTGVLQGFGNAEITGFSEAVCFSPVVNAIPFIGYIFVLDDNTDINTFTDNLRANADRRWIVCGEADETVITTSGNMVFFVMSPVSL